jgi:hypothetical protein
MPSTLSKSLVDKIDMLIAKAKTGKLVVIVHTIMKELMDAGMIYEMKIPPKLVVVHRENRDKYGVGAVDVHDLCDDFCDTGFCIVLTCPVCVEITQEDKDFNVKRLEEAQGLLGSPDNVHLACFASIASSHTNFVLRVISEHVRHPGSNQDLCKDGHFSMPVIQTESPELHTAAIEGLTWRVIRKEATDKWPALAELVQACHNTDNSRGEHDCQILRRVFNLVQAQVRRDGKPHFEQAKRAALRSKPKCAASLQLTCTLTHMPCH